jgi:hypothetical protein
MVKCCYAVSFLLTVGFAECRKLSPYVECHKGECHYAECRFADFHGAVIFAH